MCVASFGRVMECSVGHWAELVECCCVVLVIVSGSSDLGMQGSPQEFSYL